jgi:hypothetical protein
MQYYHIKDIDAIGKIDHGEGFLYDKVKGWVSDVQNRLSVWKTAPDKRPDYNRGAPPVLNLIQEISEEDAKRYIGFMK